MSGRSIAPSDVSHRHDIRTTMRVVSGCHCESMAEPRDTETLSSRELNLNQRCTTATIAGDQFRQNIVAFEKENEENKKNRL